MAWVNFPVATGHRITADMLNELRTACVERGFASLPAELSSGYKIPVSFITDLQTSISAGYSAFYNVSYTDATTWSHAAWSASSLFGTAFGGSYSNWRNVPAAGHRLTAQCLSDIYAVLNLLRTKSVSPTHTFVSGSRNGSGADCAATLTDMDDNAYTGGSGSGESTYLSLVRYPYPIAGNGNQTHSARIVTYPSSSAVVSKLYLNPSLILYRQYDVSYAALARTIALGMRFGTAAAPSTWSAAQTYGTSFASENLPTGTHYDEFSRYSDLMLKAEPGASGVIRVIVTPGELSATGSSICALGGTSKSEVIGMPSLASFAEYSYDKLAA